MGIVTEQVPLLSCPDCGLVEQVLSHLCPWPVWKEARLPAGGSGRDSVPDTQSPKVGSRRGVPSISRL